MAPMSPGIMPHMSPSTSMMGNAGQSPMMMPPMVSMAQSFGQPQMHQQHETKTIKLNEQQVGGFVWRGSAGSVFYMSAGSRC